MSTEREATRIVEAWLEEGPNLLPDRVLDAVIGQIPATHQRRAGWLARRFPIMNSTVLRLGVAAVAVIVAGVIGFNLLSGSNVGAPTSTSTPTPAATPPPTPTVAPTPANFPEGQIPPGRYHQTQESVPYSVAISSDLWQSDHTNKGYGFIETREAFPKPGYVWITFLTRLDAVSIDPCAGTERSVTSMDDAATAMTQIAGTTAVGPADTTIDGMPAKLVVLTMSGPFACDKTSFWLYGDTSFYPDDQDSVIRDWVFDRNGQTYLLHTDQIGADATLGDEVQRIIESIQFE